MIIPGTSTFDELGPLQVSVRLNGGAYAEGEFVPALHIKAYHENVKIINVVTCPDEIIEMQVPRGFTENDLLNFMKINGKQIYNDLQRRLDKERSNPPEPLTYNGKVPYLGEYMPIRVLSNGEMNEGFREHAVYLKQGLSSDGIRESVLRLYGKMVYSVLKPRLDHFAKIMNLQYSVLEIDDGRRTWGTYNAVTHVIFLTRRLLMMSEAVIDSIIAHELAHSKDLSMTKDFSMN